MPVHTNRGPDTADQGAESVYQGANRGGYCDSNIMMLIIIY
jgi:hypothetical protein